MPTYVYETINEPKRTFELSHSIKQKDYTAHPISGIPIRKMITATNLSCGKATKPHPTGCNCCKN